MPTCKDCKKRQVYAPGKGYCPEKRKQVKENDTACAKIREKGNNHQ